MRIPFARFLFSNISFCVSCNFDRSTTPYQGPHKNYDDIPTPAVHSHPLHDFPVLTSHLAPSRHHRKKLKKLAYHQRFITAHQPLGPHFPILSHPLPTPALVNQSTEHRQPLIRTSLLSATVSAVDSPLWTPLRRRSARRIPCRTAGGLTSNDHGRVFLFSPFSFRGSLRNKLDSVMQLCLLRLRTGVGRLRTLGLWLPQARVRASTMSPNRSVFVGLTIREAIGRYCYWTGETSTRRP